MKKGLFTSALAFAMLPAWSGFAQADDKEAALAAVSKLYQQHYNAGEHKDWADPFDIYDASYVSVSLDGKVTSRAEIEQNFQRVLPRLREFKELLLDVEQADLRGDTLVLRVHDIDRRTWSNARGPNGLEIITTEGRYEQKWQRKPEGWKLMSSRTLEARESGRLPSGKDVTKMDPSKMTPEERQLWIMTMKQKQDNLNMSIHGQACTLGYGYNCRGW